MRSLLCLLALAAIPACGQLESEAPAAEATLEEAATKAPAWAKVAPGVWERRLSDGRTQRINDGVDGLRAVLARAHAERGELQALASAARATKPQLEKNQVLISDLESKLQSFEASGETANNKASEDTLFPPGDISTMGGVSDYVCAGTYDLSVTFGNISLVDSQVTTTSSWTEFGPYSEYLKSLATYASATGGTNVPVTDSDSIAPYKDNCCNSVSSSAIAALTFSPQMYGVAYVAVTTGCSFFRAYEEEYVDD